MGDRGSDYSGLCNRIFGNLRLGLLVQEAWSISASNSPGIISASERRVRSVSASNSRTQITQISQITQRTLRETSRLLTPAAEVKGNCLGKPMRPGRPFPSVQRPRRDATNPRWGCSLRPSARSAQSASCRSDAGMMRRLSDAGMMLRLFDAGMMRTLFDAETDHTDISPCTSTGPAQSSPVEANRER